MRLSVIAPGRAVDVLKPGGEVIPAFIAGIDIRYPDRVVYEVVFYVDEERVKDWVETFEVVADDSVQRIEIDSES